MRHFNIRSKCTNTKAVPTSDLVTIQLTTEAEPFSILVYIVMWNFHVIGVLFYYSTAAAVAAPVLLPVAAAVISCTHSFHNRVNQYSKRF